SESFSRYQGGNYSFDGGHDENLLPNTSLILTDADFGLKLAPYVSSPAQTAPAACDESSAGRVTVSSPPPPALPTPPPRCPALPDSMYTPSDDPAAGPAPAPVAARRS